MLSVFQSRSHIRYKQQIEEDLVRISDLGREIQRSESKESNLCSKKRYLEYIKNNPLLLFHRVGFRLMMIKKIKELNAEMRMERVLAHQSYHKKNPSNRTNYDAELSKYVQPIEKIANELNDLIKSIQ